MKTHRFLKLRSLLAITILIISVVIAGSVYAQDGAPTATPTPTDTPTPTATNTDIPSDTPVPPTPTNTDIPTDVPTTLAPVVTDVVTEPATEIPTDVATATEAATETPTDFATATATEDVPATATPTESLEPATDELLISYHPNAAPDEVAALLSSINAVELERIPAIGIMRVKVPKRFSSPAAASAAIRGNARSATVSGNAVELNGNYKAVTAFFPNDPLYLQGYQTNLDPIFAENAWGMNTARGTGVIIAIVDSGVNATHPDLQPNMVAGYDFVDDDTTPTDLFGHGTHVAGIAAAKGSNGIGISGIAPNAKIMPVRVLDSSGFGSYMDIAQGIVYAADKGAKVINLSLGGTGYSSTIDAAAQYAVSKGAVVVAAAGNDGTNELFYPASLPSVISVGSVDDAFPSPTVSYFSNYGKVDIVAPGENVFSTCTVSGSAPPCSTGYAVDSGTSMASPEVAGAAALLLSAKVATTPGQVREALMCGAWNDFAAYNPTYYGAGELQLDYSMNWKLNSASCQITLANDDVRTASVIGTTFPYYSSIAITGRNASIAANDPATTCNPAPAQSVWYQFKPATSGPFIFSSLGSSYDTVVSLYKGDPGSLIEIGCNNDMFGQQSVLNASLTAGQPYQIMVSSYGNPTATIVQDQILNFSAAPGIISTASKVENSATNMIYSGTWQQFTATGQSGTVARTTDNSAAMMFSIRSWNLTIGRTTGPDRGSIDVYVDGVYNSTINNRTALTTYQSPVIINFNNVLGTRNIMLVRTPGGPAGPIDVDWVQGTSPATITAISGKVDDTSTSLLYWGGVGVRWLPSNVAGAYMNTLKENNTPGDHVDFKFTGSAFTFNRALYPSPTTTEIRIDGNVYATIDSQSPTGNFVSSVPYSVVGLSNSEHIVSIAPVTGTLGFDSVAVSAPADLSGGTQIDERATNIFYSGIWTDSTVAAGLAFNNTIRSTSDPNAEVRFRFTGSTLTVKFARSSIGGTFDLYIDGIKDNPSPIDTNYVSQSYNWVYKSNVYTLAQHTVLIKPNVTTSQSVQLDSFTAATYPTLQPSQGLVADTSAAFIYSTAPYTWTTKSWARLQGGSGKTTSVNGSSVDFYINGTGALIYTETGYFADYVDVYVDGVLYTTPDSPPGYSFDLFDQRNNRPVAIGIANLGFGIHRITVVADFAFVGSTLTFDGVRVFP